MKLVHLMGIGLILGIGSLALVVWIIVAVLSHFGII